MLYWGWNCVNAWIVIVAAIWVEMGTYGYHGNYLSETLPFSILMTMAW